MTTLTAVGVVLFGCMALPIIGSSSGSGSLRNPFPSSSSSASAPKICDFETHHSHLIVPLAADAGACAEANAPFLLSHGATFFCPHTYDIKLITTSMPKVASRLVCAKYFANYKVNDTLKFAFRPTLPAYGLPATGTGQATQWTSPVLYEVHNFGNSSASGPDAGWNLTTLLSQDIVVPFEVRYFRKFDLATPQPSALSYLIYAVPGQPKTALLSHFISTAPNFDQLVWVSVHSKVTLRDHWPLLLTVEGREDIVGARLWEGELVKATVHSTDTKGLPTHQKVMLHVTREIYSGVDDGFADFGFDCPLNGPRSLMCPDF